jgi:hypothetical protein
VIADLDINLSVVFLGLSDGDGASEFVALLYIACSVDVENHILPVSVWRVRGCAESDLVLEVLKFTVEPRDKSTSSSALVEFKLVLRGKVDIAFFHVNEIKINDFTIITANHIGTLLVSMRIQIVNARLLKHYICHN